MAVNKRTHIQRIHSSLREIANFDEVKDKVISDIEVSSDLEFFSITIRFQDRTTLTLIIEPSATVFPILSDWPKGNEKVIKRYKSVKSKIPRT